VSQVVGRKKLTNKQSSVWHNILVSLVPAALSTSERLAGCCHHWGINAFTQTVRRLRYLLHYSLHFGQLMWWILDKFVPKWMCMITVLLLLKVSCLQQRKSQTNKHDYNEYVIVTSAEW